MRDEHSRVGSAVTLSEHERRTLGDIERWLTRENPVLARDLSAPMHPRRRWGVVLGLAMLGIGLVLLTVGAVAGVHPVLVVGLFVAIMFPFPISLSCARALTRGRSRSRSRGDVADRRSWWRR
ncbi:DUF3040 domain-containing protein [uncultured Pseudonocardia sp.]|uniref:DUF3040 domain-containing protein n=1 Tax=uncultured Pseudonocardia sp. TaxID=211455 RepID=UPI00345B6239